MYTYLQDSGFELFFKDVLYHGIKPKGNCDSDLLMKVAQDLYEGGLDKAVIVASDGDYAPLLNVLLKKKRLEVVVSPSIPEKCSVLIKRTGAKISYLTNKRSILEYKVPTKNKKTPDEDKTS